MVRSQVTGVSLLSSFPQTFEGDSILREAAKANGPTVLPQRYSREWNSRSAFLRWLPDSLLRV
jgi:hypothetical protein